jgi:hypothetical protein
MADVREILERALAILREDSWVNRPPTLDNEVCIYKAVARVSYECPETLHLSDAGEAALEVLMRHIPDVDPSITAPVYPAVASPTIAIPQFNDQPYRTFGDVEALFEKALADDE